jgi:hypothetical protein
MLIGKRLKAPTSPARARPISSCSGVFAPTVLQTVRLIAVLLGVRLGTSCIGSNPVEDACRARLGAF